MADQERGIYRKFFVQRLSPSDASSGGLRLVRDGARGVLLAVYPPPKHTDCRYFVIDLEHDAFAGPALRAYADACEAEFPVLAAELRAMFPPAPAPSAGGETKRCTTCGLPMSDPNHAGSPPGCPGPSAAIEEPRREPNPLCRRCEGDGLRVAGSFESDPRVPCDWCWPAAQPKET